MRARAVPFAVSLALIAIAGDAAAAADKLVYRVDAVSATIENKRLVIEAHGAVKSGGWTAARLRLQRAAPQSRTLIVDLLAAPPSPHQVVIQALLPVEAKLNAPLPRYGALAVKVVSETNDITTQILP